jgi:predicted metal-dependent peptidase
MTESWAYSPKKYLLWSKRQVLNVFTLFTSMPRCRVSNNLNADSRSRSNPVGGGGTDFRPVFAYLDEQAIMPQSLIFLTDLCGQFPEKDPFIR